MNKIHLVFSLFILFSASIRASAAEPDTRYYLGEAKLSSAEGKSMGSQVILVEKTHYLDRSAIIERAIVVKPDGTSEQYAGRISGGPLNRPVG